jgi:uncharacterized protein with von Willebrand factor type A (vWA) domain
VALERRYRDYSQEGPLTQALMGEALKRLRHMLPAGPKDRLNVEATIYRTTQNAGEIEIIFDRALKDKLKVILAIDNGGWSMDPYIPLVQTLFDYAVPVQDQICSSLIYGRGTRRVLATPDRCR